MMRQLGSEEDGGAFGPGAQQEVALAFLQPHPSTFALPSPKYACGQQLVAHVTCVGAEALAGVPGQTSSADDRARRSKDNHRDDIAVGQCVVVSGGLIAHVDSRPERIQVVATRTGLAYFKDRSSVLNFCIVILKSRSSGRRFSTCIVLLSY